MLKFCKLCVCVRVKNTATPFEPGDAKHVHEGTVKTPRLFLFLHCSLRSKQMESLTPGSSYQTRCQATALAARAVPLVNPKNRLRSPLPGRPLTLRAESWHFPCLQHPQHSAGPPPRSPPSECRHCHAPPAGRKGVKVLTRMADATQRERGGEQGHVVVREHLITIPSCQRPLMGVRHLNT